jgi:hypothetical protein
MKALPPGKASGNLVFANIFAVGLITTPAFVTEGNCVCLHEYLAALLERICESDYIFRHLCPLIET